MVSHSADEFDMRDLRRQAELLLQHSPAHERLKHSLVGIENLLYELQVHQIELEMQNEELRRSRDAAEAAAERNADFYDFAPLGHVTLDRTGNITQANLTLACMLGVDRAKLAGSRFGLFVATADRLRFFEFLKKVFDTAIEQSCELALLRTDPAVLVAPVVALRAMRCQDPLLCRVVMIDISERVKLEADVLASHELLEKLSRNVPGLSFQYRRWPDGRSCFPYASEGIEDIYEVTPEQVREDASPVIARLHPDDRETVQAAIEKAASTLQTWNQEYRVNLPQRGLRWLSGVARPERLQDGSTLFHGFIADITDRISADANLHQVMQATELAILINDRDRRFTFANNAACKLLGYTLEDYRAMQIPDLLDQHTQNDLPAHLERLKTEPFLRREWLLKRKDGGTTLAELTTQRFGDDGNLAIGHDVSERKRMQLKQSALAAVVEHSDNIVVVKDLDLRVVATNQAFAQAAGYSHADDLIGKTDAEIFSLSVDTEPVRSYMNDERLAQMLPRGEFLLREEPVHSPGGEVRQVLTKKYPIYSESGQLIGTGNISTDITQLKHAQAKQLAHEAQLRDALVREVHHRIKNNLQGVIGLLRDFGRNQALSHTAIAKLVSQVQSVAVIHGLQGKHALHQVLLCELTTAIVEGVGSFWTTAVEVTIPQPWVPCPVAQQDAVSIALVINELMQNAVKHRDPPQSTVRVALQKTGEPGEVKISIVNSGQWGRRSVDKSAGGRSGLQPTGGVGLELVSALLPRHGAQLSQHVQDGQVHSVLLLAPPVLTDMSKIGH